MLTYFVNCLHDEKCFHLFANFISNLSTCIKIQINLQAMVKLSVKYCLKPFQIFLFMFLMLSKKEMSLQHKSIASF